MTDEKTFDESQEEVIDDDADVEEDFFSTDVKNDSERENAVRKFELEMARLNSAYAELESPTVEDEDRLLETKTELRKQLIVDILSTVAASTTKNTATYYRNLLQGTISSTYMVERIANDIVEEFQMKLNRRDQAEGKPVSEFAIFDSKHFLKYVRLICDIQTVDTLCNAAGYGVVESARDKIIDGVIAHHFAVRLKRPT